MARQSLPRSALSEPESFISETRLRRFIRRHGWVIWSAAAFSLLGIGAAALVANRRQEPAEQSQKVALPKTAAPAAQPPAPAAPREQMWLPWKTAESQRVVEAGKPVPEQIADLPPPVLDGPAEPTVPTAQAPAADPPAAAKPADATASVTAASDPAAPPDDDRSLRKDPPGPIDEIDKADRYLRRGQFTIARYVYEEAYKAGDARGALGLARSYDPAFLRSIGLRTGANVQRSAIWYRRAAEMGTRAQKSP